MTNKTGKVYLIGAGPGDPGLLTIKAKECIEAADVVVYDYLAAPFLLNYARKDAQIIYVGKKGGDHTLTQDKINQLLVDKAKEGFDVARLKGGDPFVFGRGGEEAQMLLSQGVSYEVVPGVTSAISAPAYAGIPVTHRDHTSFVSFITGHEDPTKKDSSMQWDIFAKSDATLVFLMGVKNLANITKNLMENGKAKDTPVALVRWGTTAKQQTVTGTLETIVDEVNKAGLKSPAIIVIGHVVSLREELAWFDNRPLFGKRIVITRARAQASNLVSALSKLGAQCIEIPTIEIAPPQDIEPLKRTIENIKNYDWLVFTSVNGVKFFFDTLYDMGKDVRVLGHLQFACIGPVTKERLRDHGIVSDILPETYRAESVVDAFSGVDIKNKNVLLPRAKMARTILPEELTRMGARVDEVTAYETRINEDGKQELISLLEDRQIDAVTFTSSSTVSNFMSLLESCDSRKLLSDVLIASIGPVTSDTAVSLGIKPDIEAVDYTIPGLVDVLLKHYSSTN
ncbi:MAG: uroporphyrinogen-III C-methyltransferase [Proteobacteria bacterium]|nr:uroporphyrinogen-III C-methyltransferase [Pseudomonadota bacterium]MBU1387443.1 uroporphyrinogen-III C-methyltransferase [Pseudomonadota bacterium]MBU1541728.1 uroporphyrinogen-III C-methyltransferase [Pseudomonadota bacterium]MBU2431278.1 uroporphyrinogen-III C-methyltransferase [Pseudomonadota bacterium]MBU2482934.1 uroporphyrinogen-III C-methyltransferase [Pseudomonadota bacterium]